MNNIFVPEQESEQTHEYHSGSCLVTRVAGVTFDGRQSVIAHLSIGESIRLRREPTNPYDSNAIRVERLSGWQIGYLNRHLAATLAPFFDAHHQSTIGNVHCVTGSQGQGYSLGVVITFNVP